MKSVNEYHLLNIKVIQYVSGLGWVDLFLCISLLLYQASYENVFGVEIKQKRRKIKGKIYKRDMEVRNISENKKKRKLLSTLTNLACRSMIYYSYIVPIYNFYFFFLDWSRFTISLIKLSPKTSAPWCYQQLHLQTTVRFLFILFDPFLDFYNRSIFHKSYISLFFIFRRIIRLPKNNKRWE